ncbi:hypothetical protein KC315_g16086 [Hortaea werneckii]|nr:hypothetical protein KC315_g16086 [Hortaea werneckii]
MDTAGIFVQAFCISFIAGFTCGFYVATHTVAYASVASHVYSKRFSKAKKWIEDWQNMNYLSESLKLKLLQTFDNPRYRNAKLHLDDPSMKLWLSKIAQQSAWILEWAAPGGTPDRTKTTVLGAIKIGLVGIRNEKLVKQLDGGYFIINHPELAAAQDGLKKLRILSDPSYM